MDSKIFDDIITDTLASCRNTLVVKAKEYQRFDNPMHNFDVGVQQSTTGESREQVIHGMARKHQISISDMRDRIALGEPLPSIEMVNEKFGDMINYLLIEKASIIDKILKTRE